MGSQIIQQPNGKLAVISDDCWAVWDGSPDEVAEWFAELAAGEARETAHRHIKRVLAGESSAVYGRQLAMTFAEANARSQHYGGEVLEGPVDPELLAVLEGPLDGADG